MKRKKILLVTKVFTPEPVVEAVIAADIAEELSKEYEVTVLRPKPTRPMGFVMPQYNDIDSHRSYHVITLGSYTCPKSTLFGRFKESCSLGKAAAQFIDSEGGKFDLIYNAAWPMFGMHQVSKMARRYNIPYINPVQDIYPESVSSKLPNIPGIKWLIKSLLLPIDKDILRNAAKIHTISDKMAEYLSSTRGIEKSRFVVARNWQDERTFGEPEPVKDHTDSPFTFMYLGNIGPLAGLDLVIDAMKLIKDAPRDYRFVIAGSGSAKQSLLEHVAQAKLTNIEFWNVPAGQVPSTQAKADVMVLPVMKGYASSSIPSKLPAYMFSARPIIASVDEGSDTAMCITNSQCGWAIAPDNPQIMADTMLTAINSSVSDLAHKGMRGRKFALDTLGRTSNLQKLTDAFKELL